jgi:hypothetical protein
MRSLTPKLTGAGGPIGPQGTNVGHQNREAMANVGVRVERFVRLRRVGRVQQIHSRCVRFECTQKLNKYLIFLQNKWRRVLQFTIKYETPRTPIFDAQSLRVLFRLSGRDYLAPYTV